MEFHRMAVWLDHREARIFQVRADGFTRETIEAPHRHIHKHPRPTRTATRPARTTRIGFSESSRWLLRTQTRF
jgi:hypothetical protein